MVTELRQITAFGLAVCFMQFSSFAQPSLSVNSAPGYPGATTRLPVVLWNATNVVAAQFDVAFDPARVSSAGLFAGRAFSNHVVRTRELGPGVRRVLAYSYVNAPVTVTMSNFASAAVLPFVLSPFEYTHSGPITPVNAILAREDGTAVTPLTLSAGRIMINSVNRLPNGHVQFFLPVTPNGRYIIQATTDLSSWVNISTNVATSPFMDLVDIDAPAYPYRFYRWELVP